MRYSYFTKYVAFKNGMGFNSGLHLKTLRATTLKFTMPGNVKIICISVGFSPNIPYGSKTLNCNPQKAF